MIKYKIRPNFNLQFFELLYKNNINFYIAGGSVLSLVQRTKNIQSTFNDIDIWFKTEEDYKKAFKITEDWINENKNFNGSDINYILNDTIIPVEEHPNNYLSYSNDNLDSFYINSFEVQFIKLNFGPPEKITDEFSLDNSKYWSFYPFYTVYTKQPESTLYNIKTKNYKNYFVLQKVKKYQINKNLNISNLYKNIIKTIENKEIDLTKFKTDYKNEKTSMYLDYFLLFMDEKKYQEKVNKSNIDFRWLTKNIDNIYDHDFKMLNDPLLYYLSLQTNQKNSTKEEIQMNYKKMIKYYPEYLL